MYRAPLLDDENNSTEERNLSDIETAYGASRLADGRRQLQ